MKKCVLLSAILFAIFLSACTENPFSKPERIKNLKIKGEVQLDDGTTPDQVYVWLETLNIGSFTDQEGQFHLSLPPSQLQEGSAGITGKIKLYFYLSNYQITHKIIEFAEGDLVEDQEVINDQGILAAPVILQNILTIRMEAMKDSLHCNSDEFFRLIIRMTTPLEKLKTMHIVHVGRLLKYYGLIFESESSPTDNRIFYDKQGNNFIKTTIHRDSPLTINYDVDPDSIGLTPGRYWTYPYVVVIQPDTIPDQILNNIGTHTIAYGHHYHLLPMKMEKLKLTVLEY